MLMIRSWNRWVCSTHPRLTRRAVAQRDQVGLGQPVASRTTRRGRSARPSARSHSVEHAACRSRPRRTTARRPSRRTCPPARCARRSELHSGCSAGRDPADQQPLGRGRDARGDDAGARAAPARRAARRPAAPSRSQARQQRRAARRRRAPTVQHHRHEPAQLDQRRAATLQPRAAAAKVRLSSPLAGGAAQLHRRAAQPGRARLGLLAAPPTAPPTRPRLGTDRARARSSRSCRGTPACRSWPRSIAHPAAAQLVGADQGVVGEERAVADGGHPRQQQHGRRLDVAADRRRRARAATPA